MTAIKDVIDFLELEIREQEQTLVHDQNVVNKYIKDNENLGLEIKESKETLKNIRSLV